MRLALLVAALTLGGLGAGCRATARDAGREVSTTVALRTTPERAMRAFLDHDDLAGWWRVSRARVDQRVGGTWTVTWDDYGEEHTNHVWSGVLTRLEPRRIVIERLVLIEPGRPLFAPLELELRARPTRDGCELEVRHRGYRAGPDWDWMHDTVKRGWHHVLADLAMYVAAH